MAHQTVDKKLISPQRGRLALSANERIAEFLDFAIQTRFAYVNKPLCQMAHIAFITNKKAVADDPFSSCSSHFSCPFYGFTAGDDCTPSILPPPLLRFFILPLSPANRKPCCQNLRSVPRSAPDSSAYFLCRFCPSLCRNSERPPLKRAASPAESLRRIFGCA